MAHATIQLDKITVVNKREEVSRDEAYLWVIGLQIIVPSSNVPDLEFIRATNPLPGNLGGVFKRGETRAIPPAIGRIAYDVTYPGLATFGVAVIAWEHDRTPNAAIQSAYNQACRTIDEEIRKLINGILADGVAPKTGKLRDPTPQEQEAIRAAVRETIKKVIVGSLGVAPWTLNFDDFIGGERIIEKVTGQAVFQKPFTLDLRKHENIGAHYRVTGSLRFEP
jgi:hypothetical protein